MPRIARSTNKPDARSSTSANNVAKARAVLQKYIAKGKEIQESDSEESEEFELEDDDVEEYPQEEIKAEEPPQPEPVKADEEKNEEKVDIMKEEYDEMRAFFKQLKEEKKKPPESIPEQNILQAPTAVYRPRPKTQNELIQEKLNQSLASMQSR